MTAGGTALCRPGRRAGRTNAILSGLAAALLLTSGGGCAKRLAPVEAEPPRDERTIRTIEHRVAPGETLALIADNYYGDPARAGEIARDNGLSEPERLAVGSTLILRFDAESWSRAQRRAVALESYNRGVAALETEDLEGAQRHFEAALQTAPGLVSAQYNLALVLDRRGRHDEAVAILERIHAQRPADTDVAFALGHALFGRGEFARAAAQFQAILAEHPDHRRAAFGRARCLQESGDEIAAAAAWRRYLELDATSSWADQARRHLRELERD